MRTENRLSRIDQRFWAKVKPPRGIGECWQWIGYRNSAGYGVFKRQPFVSPYRAHRFAYERLVGPIPEGLTIDHLCRNRSCVNPYHMEVVTMRVNTLRGISIIAKNAKKTHCLRGHQLTVDNLTLAGYKRGQRTCRICQNTRDVIYRRRKKLGLVVAKHA